MKITPKELELLPNGMPTRVHSVGNWGDFVVPRHIVRIDIDEIDKRGTHGWQVRYRGTKFFSDTSNTDKDVTPITALSEAIKYLANKYDGQSAPIRKIEFDNKLEKTGASGVRIVRKLNKRDFEEVYVEVSHPEHGKSAKKFYVGTANTATQARMDKVLEEAKKYRQVMVSMHIEMRKNQSLNEGKFLRPGV